MIFQILTNVFLAKHKPEISEALHTLEEVTVAVGALFLLDLANLIALTS